MRNNISWVLIFCLTATSGGLFFSPSSLYGIEIYNSTRKQEHERKAREKEAQEKALQEERKKTTTEGKEFKEEKLPVVITKSSEPWTLGYYDKNTEERIKFKQLQQLLNSAPTNSKYKTRNIAYTTMGSIGAVIMGAAFLVPLGYKLKKEEIPRPAFAASMSLLGVGFVTTTVFFSLRDLNRDKAVERYNEFILGVQKKF